ncbi:MAG: LytTR family DNA-binding domain-containing protein [Clostridia bacterium]
MKIIICEDDPFYLKSIPEKINRWSEEIGCADIKIETFHSSEHFLAVWGKGFAADIIFLDIQFQNEIDGMEVAREIRKTDIHVPIVFITNSDAFIREGYIVYALRYLSKPISYEDLIPCLNIAYKQYTLSHNEFLILSEAGRRLVMRHAEIIYLEAQSPHTWIFKQGEQNPVQSRYCFSEVLQKLPPEMFVPCHRSYAVNLIHIRCLKRTELLLSNNKILPVSRVYSNLLINAFDSYYQEGANNCVDHF